MNLFKFFTTPEYLFRPGQVFHRMKRVLRRDRYQEIEPVDLPWGHRISVRPGEVVGSNIWCYGIFDLVVAETIWRLLDAGETALDVGANIGQMTSLMSCRVEPEGRVISFEPHPEVFAELRANIEGWKSARIELRNEAMGKTPGEALLGAGPNWAANRGTARIVSVGPTDTPNAFRVRMTTLDEVLGAAIRVAVCKLDVEGHEMNVLWGGTRSLKGELIRDLIFEELGNYPSEAHRFLLEMGFSIFSLHSRILGPRLEPASASTAFNEGKDGRNYLATLDPARAKDRFRRRGWRSLRSC